MNLDVELLKFAEYKRKAKDLDYMGEGGLAPCTPRQRGYVYGLLDKIGADLLDYGVEDLKDMTIIEVGELIDTLKNDAYNVPDNRTKNDWF